MPNLRRQVIANIGRTFQIKQAEAESLYLDMKLCMKRRDLVSYFFLLFQTKLSDFSTDTGCIFISELSRSVDRIYDEKCFQEDYNVRVTTVTCH